MPKRFRLYFRFNRQLLRKLPRLAWETVLEVYRAALGREDVVPGMVAAKTSPFSFFLPSKPKLLHARFRQKLVVIHNAPRHGYYRCLKTISYP